jgi:hypothetical protein
MSSCPCFGFDWTCPACGWSGEIHIDSRWGLHAEGCLHVGDEFHLPADWPSRDLLIYETFSCPQCATAPANCYLAEIRSLGNQVWSICAFKAPREEDVVI